MHFLSSMFSFYYFSFLFFFFNDTATTEIYTLSLHDALPTCPPTPRSTLCIPITSGRRIAASSPRRRTDRKSTRLNSSHPSISYAVFCLKKKKKTYFACLIQIKKKQKC